MGTLGIRGVVLRIPFFGRFMCPLEVAGLAFKYFFDEGDCHVGAPFKETLFQGFKEGGYFGIAL
jgi:hypothetical protein